MKLKIIQITAGYKFPDLCHIDTTKRGAEYCLSLFREYPSNFLLKTARKGLTAEGEQVGWWAIIEDKENDKDEGPSIEWGEYSL